MHHADTQGPALLVLDASYTLEMIRDRGIEKSVTCRDLDGFFRHVWSVHPFASLLASERWGPRFGTPAEHVVNERHTFIEGKIGRFAWLKGLAPLNFVLSQACLFGKLWALIRRERIGVIRVGDPLYLGLFGLGLARLTGARLAIRVNSNNQRIRDELRKPVSSRLFRSVGMEERIERFVFPRADLVAALNPENLTYALDSGARPERTTLFRLGNLIADEHFIAPADRGCDDTLFETLGIRPKRYLLSVARLVDVKMTEDVLEAFSGAREAGFDVDLVFAGDGPEEPKLRRRARDLNLEDSVRFVGNQNQRALAQLNAHAAVVISPLTGRALSESALGAAPIVAYDLDWQGELIRTGETGELVPFRRTDLLAESTVKLLGDPEYAARMGQAARERALEMLDPAALNEHEREEYAKLLGAARGDSNRAAEARA